MIRAARDLLRRLPAGFTTEPDGRSVDTTTRVESDGCNQAARRIGTLMSVCLLPTA